MKFKVGDRVAVYGHPDITDGSARIVLAIMDCGNLEIDRNEFAHPKQCRRLVKKPRRRIWVPIGYIPSMALHQLGGGGFGQMLSYLEDGVGSPHKPNSEHGSYYQYVEFVEVCRKKKA